MDARADQILSSVAEAYGGDADRAVSDLLLAHESIETFFDDLELEHGVELARQKEKSERGFREGRFTTWEEVKRRNGL